MHRFQQNLATVEERLELMQMIESDDFNKEIGDDWENLLKANFESHPYDNNIQNIKLREIRTRLDRRENIKNANTKKKKYFIIFRWVSAAAAVALLLTMGIFWSKDSGNPKEVVQDVVQENSNGKTFLGKQYVKLPDGSSVTLNEGSELKYGTSFGDRIREVYLSGEAYFDITHNPEIPFIVRTGKIQTRVLGTAFNVEAWPDQTEVKVTVSRGKVSVGDGQNVFDELVPDEQLVINTESQKFEKSKIIAEDAIEWKSGFFVLDKVAMNEAVRQISERYNVEVTIENKQLGNCLVNGAFLENENMEHVVSVICLAMNATYEVKGDHVRIKGGIGCK